MGPRRRRHHTGLRQRARLRALSDAARRANRPARHETGVAAEHFLALTTEAIWRFDLDEPIAIDAPPAIQIDHFYTHGYLALGNPAIARMYGVAAAEDLIGRRLDSFLLRADPQNAAYLQAFIESGYDLRDAESHELDDAGHSKYFLNNLVGIVRDGRLYGAWGTQRDITEQKQLALGLQLLLDISDRLLDQTDPAAIVRAVAALIVPRLADCCAIYRRASDDRLLCGAVAQAGPDQDMLAAALAALEPRGDPARSLIAKVACGNQPELLQPITPQLWEQLSGAPAKAGHGADRSRSGLVAPIPAPGGPCGAIVLLMAESRRSYTQQDLLLAHEIGRRAGVAIAQAQLHDDRRQALLLRDNFVSVAAHEMRLPLTTTLGYAQLLQRRLPPGADDRIREPLDALALQIRRLQSMVETMFDSSRLESGQLTVNRAPIDLAALARQAVADLQPTLPRHALAYWDDGAPHFVSGDATRLIQALQNLISNAVKYSPQADRIEVELRRNGADLALAVRDYGIGIPADEVALVQQRFYRASNAAEASASGLGIGLYVVQEIVRQHGGILRLRPGEGGGTVATIHLPAEP